MSSNMTPFTDAESNGNKMRSTSNKTKREKHLIAAVVILAIVVLAFVIAVIALALKGTKRSDVCTTHGCLATALELLEAMNTTVDPCDDFYQFACGKWAISYSGFGAHKLAKAGIKVDFAISDAIVKASTDPDMPQTVKKIAGSYTICGKYGDLRETDIPWLLITLQEVGGWPMMDKDWKENQYHWERNMAQSIRNLSILTPIAVTVEVNYLDSRKHIINVNQHPLAGISPFNKEKILSIARRIGDRDNDNSLEREYQEMEEFAQQLMKMSRPDSDLAADPNERKVLTIRELKILIPWVNWTEFLRTVFGPYLQKQLHDSESVFLLGPTYISKVLEIIFNGGVTKRTLANYIAATFIQSLIDINNNVGVQNALLSTKDSSGNLLKDISIPQGYVSGCLSFIKSKAGVAVDFINYKYRKTEYLDETMIPYFFNTMKDMIEMATWLDEKTRQAALEKLKEMKYYPGFPAIAKDSNKVVEYFRGLPDFTDNALQNQLELQRHHFKKRVELLSKNVDRNSWPTVEGTHGSQLNAFYVLDINGIVIPADIQVESLYSPERPKYWNFGSFGWIIAHEITHGFDTSGSRRDKYGNIKNWWTPEANKEFERRSRCFIEQYDKIKFGYKGYHLNGTKTLPENVADNGGFRQAFTAYKKWEKENGKEKRLPGLEKYDPHQLFFISATQTWCSVKTSPENLYNSALHDAHTPTAFRPNAAASNSEDFAKVFKCKSGSPINPTQKCVIW